MNQLQKDEMGIIITKEHKAFQDMMIYLYNVKVPQKPLEEMLNLIKGTDLNKESLKKNYEEFKTLNRELIDKNINKIDKLLTEFNDYIESLLKGGFFSSAPNQEDIVKIIKKNNPKILAYIFAIYTLMNSKFYSEQNENERKGEYLFQPHCAQILSILRIFGSDNEKSQFENNLVQIGTGEGKSVTLAVVSIIFARFDFDVNCACYSQILSARDYENFKPLFEKLKVVDKIYYGTFDQLCEKVINEDGFIRDNFVYKLMKNQNEVISSKGFGKKKILLIDEVDVFFSPEFYGRLYCPSAQINDKYISELIDYIWQNKKNELKLKVVKEDKKECYLYCQNLFKDSYKSLVEVFVESLISDVQTYAAHSYEVVDNKIGYKSQDSINFKIYMGYKTLFAYLHELDIEKITDSEDLKKAKCMLLNCGNFSYAHLAQENFPLIMGVTGTLETLNKIVKKELSTFYKISKQTLAPSVYGEKQLAEFDLKEDLKITKEDDYYNTITNEIKRRQTTQENDLLRPLIVVFENRTKLMNYYNHKTFEDFTKNSDYLTEIMNDDRKKQVIERATRRGHITLIERSFGRGTDFILSDEKIIQKGGYMSFKHFFPMMFQRKHKLRGEQPDKVIKDRIHWSY